MPTYNFRNKETNEEFEIQMSMSELDKYKEDNPHLVQFLTGAPSVSINAHRYGGTNLNKNGSFKEVLKNIHERTPGSHLNKTTDI